MKGRDQWGGRGILRSTFISFLTQPEWAGASCQGAKMPHYVLRVWGLQPWLTDACWICPVTQMGFCLGKREMQADEL